MNWSGKGNSNKRAKRLKTKESNLYLMFSVLNYVLFLRNVMDFIGDLKINHGYFYHLIWLQYVVLMPQRSLQEKPTMVQKPHVTTMTSLITQERAL